MRPRVFSIFFCALIICACDTVSVKKVLQEMYANTISIPDSLIVVPGTGTGIEGGIHIDSTQYRLVVFVDSTSCTSCRAGSFPDYHYLTSQDVSLALIIESAPKTASFIKTMIQHMYFPFDVYLDISHSFLQQNSFIPESDHRYHVILTDSSGKPLLVGDPTRNTRIKELYDNITNQ